MNKLVGNVAGVAHYATLHCEFEGVKNIPLSLCPLANFTGSEMSLQMLVFCPNLNGCYE